MLGASNLHRPASASFRRHRATPLGAGTPYAVDTSTFAANGRASPKFSRKAHPFKRDLSYAAYSLRVDEVRLQIAEVLCGRGVVGVFAFIRSLQRSGYNGELSMARFEQVIEEHRLGLTKPDMALLFSEFDERRRSLVVVEKVIDAFRMRLEPRTLDLIEMIFKSFQTIHSRVQATDIRRRFQPAHHPDVLSRKRSETDVLVEFLDTFTLDLEATRYDLVRYYELVRLSVASDADLYNIIRGCWSEFVPADVPALPHVRDDEVQTVDGNFSELIHPRVIEPSRDRDATSLSPDPRWSRAATTRDPSLDRPVAAGAAGGRSFSRSSTPVSRRRDDSPDLDAEARRLERLSLNDRPLSTLERLSTSNNYRPGDRSHLLAPTTVGHPSKNATTTNPSYVSYPWDKDSLDDRRPGSRPLGPRPAFQPETTFSFASPVAIGVHDGQVAVPKQKVHQIDAMHVARGYFRTPMTRPLVRLRRALRAEADINMHVDQDAFVRAWNVATDGMAVNTDIPLGVWEHVSGGEQVVSVNHIMRVMRLRDPTPRRVQIVDQAFSRLDTIGHGTVPRDAVLRVYQASAGQSSASKSHSAADLWGCLSDNVSREEFQEYYADIGSAIDDDNYFVLMVWQEWSL